MLFLKKGLKSYIMSFHVGASGVNGSSRVRDCGSQDAGKETNNSEIYTPCLKTARPELGSERSAEEERTSSVEQLLRPALPGRKVYKKSCKEDNRGRWREKNQDKDDNRQNIEDVGGREGGKQRQKRSARTATHGDVQHERQVTGSSESFSSSNSDFQCNSFLEAGEGLDNLWRGHACPRPHNIDCFCTSMTNLNAEPPWLAMTSMSSVLPQLPIQTRSTLSPHRLSCSAVTGDSVQFPFSSSREPDPFWVNVRSRSATERSLQSHYTQKHITSLTSSELGAEEENEEEGDQDVGDGNVRGSGAMKVMSQTMIPGVVPPCVLTEEKRMNKREKNQIKCLRRRHRRRERWKQSQLQESRQRPTGNPSSSSSSSSEDEECVSARDREGYICAVCLDVYFSPYMCHPCNHIFCEPCLRTLAKNSPSSTPCPLCRTIITHVFFQKELSQTARAFFPKEYLSRKQNFQKACCAKWPLPSCRKLFHIFGGFQRQSNPIPRHQLPHGEGYRMDAMDFEDNPQRRRFDMDMVIIYIYSVNWVIGFFIFCFLCYLFFPSF